MSNKHRAFTMIEFVVASAILAALVVFSLNINTSSQTAEREAQRVLNYIHRLTQKSNRIHAAFSFWFESDRIKIHWDLSSTTKSSEEIQKDEILQATPGCEYELFSGGDSEGSFLYTLDGDFKPGGTIKITGSDKSIYYVILSPAGRTRISKTPPE